MAESFIHENFADKAVQCDLGRCSQSYRLIEAGVEPLVQLDLALPASGIWTPGDT